MQIELGRERPGVNRQALVSALLAEALPSVTLPDTPPVVLDFGGGSGTYAVPLAAAGASVTVVDISADALATLRRRAIDDGVSERVTSVQGDAEAVDELVAAGSFDLVLAHGVLDAVDDVATTFAALSAAVRPGGLLSLLVDNPVAAVVARALSGEPAAALRELVALDDADAADAADGAVSPTAIERLCVRAGMSVESRHGIGVFSDIVPGAALDRPDSRAALAELDAAAAGRSPFVEIAGRVHLLARRPG